LNGIPQPGRRSSKGDFAADYIPALGRGFSLNQELSMLKSLVVLAVACTMSVPATAQTTVPAANQAQQQVKPKMVKKRVCEESGDVPYSRIKTKSCKTVMVPAQPSTASGGQSAPAQAPQSDNGQ
jgi:hypothetical protein